MSPFRSHSHIKASGLSTSTGRPVPVIVGIVIFLKILCFCCSCFRYCKKKTRNNSGIVLQPADKPNTDIFVNPTQIPSQTTQSYPTNFSGPNLAPYPNPSIAFYNSNLATQPVYPPVYTTPPIGFNLPYPTENSSYPAVNSIQTNPDLNLSSTHIVSTVNSGVYPISATIDCPSNPIENIKMSNTASSPYPIKNNFLDPGANPTITNLDVNTISTKVDPTHNTGINPSYPIENIKISNTTSNPYSMGNKFSNPEANRTTANPGINLISATVDPTHNTGVNPSYPIKNTNNKSSTVSNPNPTGNNFSNPVVNTTYRVEVENHVNNTGVNPSQTTENIPYHNPVGNNSSTPGANP